MSDDETVPLATVRRFVHDLAQPIVALDGFLTVLDGADGLDADQAEMVRAARQASAQLIDLVDGFRRVLPGL